MVSEGLVVMLLFKSVLCSIPFLSLPVSPSQLPFLFVRVFVLRSSSLPFTFLSLLSPSLPDVSPTLLPSLRASLPPSSIPLPLQSFLLILPLHYLSSSIILLPPFFVPPPPPPLGPNIISPRILKEAKHELSKPLSII